MLSSVCHFWKADGVTAKQPHPCAHHHHFLIQLSELCFSLSLTHSFSWHGLLLLVLWLPVFHSHSLCYDLCLQFSRLSAWWLVSLLYFCIPYSMLSFTVFACLSSCLAYRLSPCLYNLFCPQVHLSSAPMFLSHKKEMNDPVVMRICWYIYSRSKMQYILVDFNQRLPFIGEEFY